MQDLFQNSPPAAQLLGRKLLSYDEHRQIATIEYLARYEFTNRHGTVQGGLLTAMLDSATALTLVAGLPAGFTAVTRRLDSEFLKPAQTGTLIAQTKVEKKTTRDAVVSATLSSREELVVAKATAYLRMVKRR